MRRIIGKIIGFHGLKGEIKVYPLLDDIEDFHDLDSIFIKNKEYQINDSRIHKDNVLLKLEGLEDLNAVEAFKGEELEANLNEDLQAGEYYISDLIGLKVLDQNKQEIGIVSNFSEGKQQIILIKLNQEFAVKSDLMVPFVDQYILDIVIGEYVQIQLEESLLDLIK